MNHSTHEFVCYSYTCCGVACNPISEPGIPVHADNISECCISVPKPALHDSLSVSANDTCFDCVGCSLIDGRWVWRECVMLM